MSTQIVTAEQWRFLEEQRIKQAAMRYREQQSARKTGKEQMKKIVDDPIVLTTNFLRSISRIR